MHIVKRIQTILRRPKRNSESSERSTILEVKEAPAQVDNINLPTTTILSGMNSEIPILQMEPVPIKDHYPPPLPPTAQRIEGDEDDEEETVVLLAPKVAIDPNLPSILSSSSDRRSPVAGPKKEGASPQAIRFELAEVPERTNPNYKRLSAVSSSQWRVLPFGSLSNGGNPLPRPNSLPGAPSALNGGTFGMNQNEDNPAPFLGTLFGPGFTFPPSVQLEATPTIASSSFVDDKVRWIYICKRCLILFVAAYLYSRSIRQGQTNRIACRF